MKTGLVIEILKELWRYEHTDKYTEAETREALDMAIDVLSEHLDAENNYNSAKINDKMQDSAIKVDLISRKSVLDKIKEVINPADIGEYIAWNKMIKVVEKLPTIPQTAENYEWCKGCKEYDQGNHCCHRYSSFIRESLQDNINAVLEDIKAEIEEKINRNYGSMVECGMRMALETIDKHIGDTKC